MTSGRCSQCELAQRAFDVTRGRRSATFTPAGTSPVSFRSGTWWFPFVLRTFLATVRVYQISQSTSPPSFRCRASRSLITPRLVLMMQIPRPPSTGFKLGRAAVDAAARLADAADAADHPLAVGAVLQVHAELVGRLVWHFFPIPDVALALEHFGQSAFHLGQRASRRAAFRRAPRCGCGSTCRRWGRSSCVYRSLYQLAFLTPGISPVRQVAEADPADSELPIHGPRPPAQPAPPHDAGGKLRLAAAPWRSSIYLPCRFPRFVRCPRAYGRGCSLRRPQRHAQPPQQLAGLVVAIGRWSPW